MARARMYGWAPKRHENEATAKRISELKGQAAVVRDTLDAMEKDSTALATDIALKVSEGGKLVTRQDVLRVTLYYLLVFKKRGWVMAVDQPVEDEGDDDAIGDEDEDEDEDGDEDAETEDADATTIEG